MLAAAVARRAIVPGSGTGSPKGLDDEDDENVLFERKETGVANCSLSAFPKATYESFASSTNVSVPALLTHTEPTTPVPPNVRLRMMVKAGTVRRRRHGHLASTGRIDRLTALW